MLLSIPACPAAEFYRRSWGSSKLLAAQVRIENGSPVGGQTALPAGSWSVGHPLPIGRATSKAGTITLLPCRRPPCPQASGQPFDRHRGDSGQAARLRRRVGPSAHSRTGRLRVGPVEVSSE